jgi:hypothetical protein
MERLLIIELGLLWFFCEQTTRQACSSNARTQRCRYRTHSRFAFSRSFVTSAGSDCFRQSYVFHWIVVEVVRTERHFQVNSLINESVSCKNILTEGKKGPQECAWNKKSFQDQKNEIAICFAN